MAEHSNYTWEIFICRFMKVTGVLMTGASACVMYFMQQASIRWALAFSGGWVFCKVGDFYRRLVIMARDGESFDYTDPRNYPYHLGKSIAHIGEVTAMMFALQLVISVGKVFRDSGARDFMDWESLVISIVLLLASWEFERWNDLRLRRAMGCPNGILLLTWPRGAEEEIPLPTVPEKEMEPRRW